MLNVFLRLISSFCRCLQMLTKRTASRAADPPCASFTSFGFVPPSDTLCFVKSPVGVHGNESVLVMQKSTCKHRSFWKCNNIHVSLEVFLYLDLLGKSVVD